ncbi:TraR/DksA family transcriptional regulator [Chloroflexota bacterium]
MAKKYEHLRSKLEEEKVKLVHELDQMEANVRTADVRREGSPFGKREEEATESLELEKRLALEKQVQEHLVAVEHALQKFEDGTYGMCDSCGEPIAVDRLEALPQASLCVECKAKNAKSRPSPG